MDKFTKKDILNLDAGLSLASPMQDPPLKFICLLTNLPKWAMICYMGFTGGDYCRGKKEEEEQYCSSRRSFCSRRLIAVDSVLSPISGISHLHNIGI